MTITKTLMNATAVAGLLVSAGASAFATPVTFAQFQQALGGNSFVFTNTGVGTPTFTATLPVKFEYLVANGYGAALNTPILANLTLTATANGTAFGSSNIDQPLTINDLKFTAVTAGPGGGTDLLELYASDGDLTGKRNAQSGGLNGDSAAGDTVNFKSDFLNFSNTISRDYTLSFSSLIPNFNKGANGYLASFAAAGTGTFASDPAPLPSPEPASVATFAMGGFGLLGMMIKGRRNRHNISAK